MSIVLRKAEVTDCPRLMELVRELAEYERAPQAVTVTLEQFIQSGFGNHPVWWANVALDSEIIGREEEKILGFALYYIRYSTWKGQRMYLEDIVVTQAARGRGIGSMLMDQLIEE